MGETQVETLITSEDKTWAVLTHLSGFLGIIVPLSNIAIPLIVALTKKEQPFVYQNARNAFNFHVSFTIYTFAVFVLIFFLIGVVFLPVVLILWVYGVIKAAIEASNGNIYKYPFTIRFLN